MDPTNETAGKAEVEKAAHVAMSELMGKIANATTGIGMVEVLRGCVQAIDEGMSPRASAEKSLKGHFRSVQPCTLSICWSTLRNELLTRAAALEYQVRRDCLPLEDEQYWSRLVGGKAGA